MSYMHQPTIALPQHSLNQREVAEYMLHWYELSEKEQQRIRLMYARCGIETRFSCLNDFSGLGQDEAFFSQDEFPGINARMEVYFQHAPQIGSDAGRQALVQANLEPEKVTHLITVSCTGMAAPGLDLLLVDRLNLSLSVKRTSVNFMGCYAAFHALKMADAYCKSTIDANVLIVCVELCTLHFQKTYSMDNIAANLLFADGASACLVSSHPPLGRHAEINLFYSEILPAGKSDMAWHLSETGFLMTLSAYIPQLIQTNIGSISLKVLNELNMTQDQIVHWAIHPGGKKILEFIASELSLDLDQLRPSFDVLKQYGNMSAATLLFVLRAILKEENYDPMQPIYAAGFGPGLTVETMLFNCASVTS